MNVSEIICWSTKEKENNIENDENCATTFATTCLKDGYNNVIKL